MKTRSRLILRALRSLAIPVLIVGPVLADAPSDQYSPYVRANLEIGDTKTFLSWRRSVTGDRTFVEANDAQVSCPAGASYRIPTMKELLTLVDEQPHDEYEDGGLVARTIDRSAFPLTPAAEFWTSTTSAADPSLGWVVDFSTGAALLRNKGEKHFVRCVR